jgi:hypothetical protein
MTKRIYKMLLHFYPAEYTAVFAAEMLTVFDEAADEYRNRTWPAFLLFTIRELAGLISGGLTERLTRATRRHDYIVSCSGVMPETTLPAEVFEGAQRVKFLIARMEYAIAHHQFEKARLYSNEEHKERENLLLLKKQYGIEEIK